MVKLKLSNYSLSLDFDWRLCTRSINALFPSHLFLDERSLHLVTHLLGLLPHRRWSDGTHFRQRPGWERETMCGQYCLKIICVYSTIMLCILRNIMCHLQCSCSFIDEMEMFDSLKTVSKRILIEHDITALAGCFTTHAHILLQSRSPSIFVSLSHTYVYTNLSWKLTREKQTRPIFPPSKTLRWNKIALSLYRSLVPTSYDPDRVLEPTCEVWRLISDGQNRPARLAWSTTCPKSRLMMAAAGTRFRPSEKYEQRFFHSSFAASISSKRAARE